MIFLGVHSESIVPFMEYFFLSRKLCFLWSPCLLLIAESISLDTSGKPTVEFFLKITSPSWIILSISLDELNLIWLIVEELMMNFLDSRNNFYFMFIKEFWYDKKILELFWRIYLNIIFWILLWMLTSLVIWNLNITEHYPEILLQVSLK